MPKEEWGVKRLCPTTGRRFYDLNRSPVVSPYTGEIVDIEAGKVSRVLVEDKEDRQSSTGDIDLLEDEDEDEDVGSDVDLDDDILEDDDDDDDVSLDDITDMPAGEDEG
jgi:uncharacterized protein (TIGR02300 family)